LQAPPVLKHFTWKLCHGILATKSFLHSKGILTDPSCPLCNYASESIFHVVWSYQATVAVWQKASRKLQKMVLEDSDGAGFLEQLIEKLEGEEPVEALLVVRSIWLRRNAVIFNNTFTPPVTVSMQAKSVLIDFLQVQNGGVQQTAQPALPPPQWQKPPPGILNSTGTWLLIGLEASQEWD